MTPKGSFYQQKLKSLKQQQQSRKGSAKQISDVLRRCPPQLTGADMYALCADAWMNGLKRLVAEVRCLVR